jgi:hypothetical protein
LESGATNKGGFFLFVAAVAARSGDISSLIEKGDLFKHMFFFELACEGQHGYLVPLVSIVKKNICF